LAGASAEAQVRMRLGKVKGPGWSRSRAAIQVALERREEVEVVRSDPDGRVGGRIRRGGRGFVADLFVLTPDRERRGRARFSGVDRRALARDIQERLWRQLGDEILALRPQASPAGDADLPPGEAPAETAAPPPGPGAPDKPSKRPARPPVKPRPAPAASVKAAATGPRTLAAEVFRFSMGAGVYARQFTWVDDLFENLAEYSLGGAPSFRLGAEWYPGAAFGGGPEGWIGLEAEAELPFAVESDREGVSFPTAASAWRLGVLGRFPTDLVEVRLGVGIAERRFAIEVAEGGLTVPDLPEVRYQTLSARVGLTARLLERVDLSVQGGWGFMLDAGAIGRRPWFPGSSSHTASAGAALGVHIARGFGLVGRFDWQGAFFDLNPRPEDEGVGVAGGASDQFFLGTVGLSYAVGS
jgi:hypothetical protein